MFFKSDSDKFPPYRNCDYRINLQKRKIPLFGKIYEISRGKLKILKKYLKQNLLKGFIRIFLSSVAVSILFAKKPDSGFRFCVDYRILNNIIIKNRYPLSLIKKTLNRFSEIRYFIKINIIAAFNRIRIKKMINKKRYFEPGTDCLNILLYFLNLLILPPPSSIISMKFSESI
jgi:hypothetical protein